MPTVKSHCGHKRSVQAKGTPFKKPKKRGGSPRGVSRPPMLLTAKMKKITVCFTYLRSELARSTGRMSTIEAPMVPMKLASTAPMPK